MKPVKAVYPFQSVSMDTGYVMLKDGLGEPKYRYFVVAVDHFTKWVEVKTLTHYASKGIMDFILNNIAYWHGCPVHIKTDIGKPYVSNVINQFFDQYEINI